MEDVEPRPTSPWRTVNDRWPPRRWVVVVPVAAVLVWVLVNVAPVAPTAGRGGAWWVLVLLTAVAGAGTLASYVPATGRRPDLGCSPCAMLSALTVLGAVLVMRSSGAEPTGPVLALAVALFGLGQRLAQPPVCPTPPADQAPEPPAGTSESGTLVPGR